MKAECGEEAHPFFWWGQMDIGVCGGGGGAAVCLSPICARSSVTTSRHWAYLSMSNSPKRRISPVGKRGRSSSSPPPLCAANYPALPTGATQRRVFFKNRFGETLAGVFVEPSNAEDVVVLCHGFCSGKDGFHFPVLASELAKRQLCSLRFDFSGNGESAGVFEFGNYAKEVGEVKAAVGFVRESLKKNVQGLVGHSKGANVVLLYTSAFDDVPYVVNVAGRFDMKAGLAERFGDDIFSKLEKHHQVEQQGINPAGVKFKWLLTKRSMEERLNTNMQEAAEKIKVSEVLTIHGTKDQVIPCEDAKHFAQFIMPHVLAQIEGADHNFTEAAASNAMIHKLVNFLTSGV